MESEKGIIIIGHCRSGKQAMMQHALKHCFNMQFRESIEEIKKLNHHFETAALAGNNLREALLKLVEIEKARRIEKPTSKFISRPIHNFRRR